MKKQPTSVIFAMAKREIAQSIGMVQRKYELPSYMLDIILGAISSEIKELKTAEIIAEIQREESEESEPAKEN